MNPIKIVYSICLLTLCSLGLLAAPVRVFYDVGPATYEVKRFEDGLPVLDAVVEDGAERNKLGGKWSFSGELIADEKFMSRRVDYFLEQKPIVYTNRDSPPKYGVYLGRAPLELSDWKVAKKSDNLVVFGWLVGSEIRNMMVATTNALDDFKPYLRMELSDNERDGALVAWVIDDLGEPVALVEGRQRSPKNDIFLAALSGDLDSVERILSASPKLVNEKDATQRTPLMHAAMRGRTEVARFLVENGAKKFEVDKWSVGALEIAAKGGWEDIVSLMVSSPSKGSSQRFQYSVATVRAFNERHQAIAIHLMEHGGQIDLDRKNAAERVIGLLANECVELARWIMAKYKVAGSYSKDGINYLHASAAYADVLLLESLKEAGASLTEISKNNTSPLHVACGAGNRQAICWFMENEGRPTEETHLDPILYAINKRMVESVSCLIEYGMSVNKEQVEGASALMFACSVGEREIAEVLLDAGAVWLFESKFSDGALRDLIRMDSPKLLKGIFDQGLSVDHRLYQNVRLYDIAEFYEAHGIIDLLDKMVPGSDSRLIDTKELASKPEILKRSQIEYPFDLQEKYGDLDVLLKIGISRDGHVRAVAVDEEIPSELRRNIERSLLSWAFKPLETNEEDAIVVVKFKLPLRMSVREEDVFDLARVDDLPKALHQVDPNYPFTLKQANVGGFVELHWIIDTEGRVIRPKVILASHADFVQPAIESIQRSRWKPAMKDGVPVAVRVTQRMDFNP